MTEIRKWCQKNTLPRRNRSPILELFFELFGIFLTLNFSFIFGVTSESELYALWRRKGAQKEVFGKPFRSHFEVSGESENEAPV